MCCDRGNRSSHLSGVAVLSLHLSFARGALALGIRAYSVIRNGCVNRTWGLFRSVVLYMLSKCTELLSIFGGRLGRSRTTAVGGSFIDVYFTHLFLRIVSLAKGLFLTGAISGVCF